MVLGFDIGTFKNSASSFIHLLTCLCSVSTNSVIAAEQQTHR